MPLPDYRTFLGRLLRLPLRLLPHGAVLRVLRGPLRGMRWRAGAGPHGAWLGSLEPDKLLHFVHRLRPGDVVYDIGANVGLYTLASARAITESGRVYAFEPMPRNLAYLREHVRVNRLENVQIVPAAVADTDGMLRFAEGDSPSEFHASAVGEHTVRAVALDRWMEDVAARPPTHVKIDVEGAEDAVLRGGARMFHKHKPMIYLALHGEPQRHACRKLLDDWGYHITSLEPAVDVDGASEWLAEAQ